MIGVDKADFHAAYLYFVTVMNFVKGVIRNVVFFEFPFNEAAYQFRCVHGHVYFIEQVGQAADMVFVTMGNDDSSYFVPVFNQVTHVRDDEVDAEHIVIGEGQTGIDDDNVVSVLDNRHVFADFT